MVVHLFLIECDPSNSLGGSCVRDLYNTAHHVNSAFIYVFTTSIPPMDKFPKQAEFYTTNIMEFKKCVNKVRNGETMVVLISGHGYQMRDNDGDEIDGMDEYIKTRTGIIKDDMLRRVFITPLLTKPLCRFIGLVDTCHSGTMFDLDYSFNGKNWIKDTKRDDIKVDAISIGACRDNELDNCDVGTIGYGGALTIHLIDNNLIRTLINNKGEEVYHKLKKIFKTLNQCPVLQKCQKD